MFTFMVLNRNNLVRPRPVRPEFIGVLIDTDVILAQARRSVYLMIPAPEIPTRSNVVRVRITCDATAMVLNQHGYQEGSNGENARSKVNILVSGNVGFDVIYVRPDGILAFTRIRAAFSEPVEIHGVRFQKDLRSEVQVTPASAFWQSLQDAVPVLGGLVEVRVLLVKSMELRVLAQKLP